MKKFLVTIASIALLSACACGKKADKGDGAAILSNDASIAAASAELKQKAGDVVYFAFNSSGLDESALVTLSKQAQFMKQNSELNFTIEGHCDQRGTREYNLALGERRAFAARKYLVGQGVDGVRLSTISYGKERPAVEGDSEEAYAQNRRDVTVVR